MKTPHGNLVVGSKVNLLTIIDRVQLKAGGEWHWVCKCDCGSSKLSHIRNAPLLKGIVKSCGCLKAKNANLSGLGKGWVAECIICKKEFHAKSHKQDVCSQECRFLLYSEIGGAEGCWNWNGPLNANGYGVIFLTQNNSNGKRISTSAHRYSYQKYHGEIPSGMCVMHSCDNPSCVNPNHLSLGTWADNNRDRANKGRNGTREWDDDSREALGLSLRGEKNGFSKLTEEDARAIKNSPNTPRADLAAKYGVSVAAIKAIRSGRNWSYL